MSQEDSCLSEKNTNPFVTLISILARQIENNLIARDTCATPTTPLVMADQSPIDIRARFKTTEELWVDMVLSPSDTAKDTMSAVPMIGEPDKKIKDAHNTERLVRSMMRTRSVVTGHEMNSTEKRLYWHAKIASDPYDGSFVSSPNPLLLLRPLCGSRKEIQETHKRCIAYLGEKQNKSILISFACGHIPESMEICDRVLCKITKMRYDRVLEDLKRTSMDDLTVYLTHCCTEKHKCMAYRITLLIIHLISMVFLDRRDEILKTV